MHFLLTIWTMREQQSYYDYYYYFYYYYSKVKQIFSS